MKGIERLIAALGEADLIAGSQASLIKLAAEDIADIIWLLLYIDQKQGRQERAKWQQDEPGVENTFMSLQESTLERKEPRPVQSEEKVHQPLEAEATRHAYLRSQRSRLLHESSVTLFRVPAASALPESLDIARALRPLMRRIPSRTNALIDELATAHRTAETQKRIWTPALKAAPMRWLEIALVIDCGESMAPWRQTIDELRMLLAHHGAFRDVRMWRLVTGAKESLQLYAGENANNQQERDPKELIDPTGRRLILVVTDCVSPAWQSGKAQQILDLWGHRNVVTIVQVFPKRLWTRTALRNADIVQVHATYLNRGNAGMIVRGDQAWFDEKIGDEESGTTSFLPIPVVTLEPKALAHWANMLVGTENMWTSGVVFYQNLPAMPDDTPFVENRAFSPGGMVQQFRAVASTMACKLLNLLSAAPVSFPVIRLIQQAMLPQAQQVHIAEIFLSGLLEEVFRDEATNDPDYVEYDFLPGVREIIRETVPIPDEFQVIEAVSTFLGSRYGHLRDFYALAATPSVIKDGEISMDRDSRPFAKIVASVWRHLGGMYESLANNLEQYIDELSTENRQTVPLPTDVFDTTASNPRAEHTARLKTNVKNDRKLPPNFGLRDARLERGWSQQELADWVDTTPKTISRWESGATFPTPYFRQKLCEVFGLTPRELGLIPGIKDASVKDNKVGIKNDRRVPQNLRLHDARNERGWSQMQLAEAIGTTSHSISGWESGTTFPSPYFRQKLCEVFGKTLAELGLIPPSPGPRVWTVPDMRNQFFTGREPLLALLHKRLTTARTAALIQPQALYGLGGIGKTQTATEYAYRYDEEYTHVFWMHAANRESLIADYVTLAELLELPEIKGQDQQQIVAAVKRWLASHEGWLLIMDNANDLLLAQEFLPTRHKGSILYTTRAQVAGATAASIEVEQLSVPEGTLLLLRWSKILGMDMSLDEVSEMDRAAAERIVREMDGLPLALMQAGAYVVETGCSLEDYLQLYARNRKELLVRRSRLLLGYPETVATTWSLSFQLIEQESPAAADVLRLCAFLAADAIPEELLTRDAAKPSTIRGMVVTDPFQFNDVLETLRRYSLARRDASTHMLSIHRLVQIVLRESMDEENQCQWAERTVRIVNAAFPEGNYSAVTQCHYYLPHVQECATLIAQYHLHTAEAAQLLYKAGAYQYFYGFYPQSQILHQQALAIREEVFGFEYPDVAESFNALAMLARNQGDYEQAETFHLRALSIREKTLGRDHLVTAESLNNLSVLYRSQREYEQAEPLLQQALNIRKQMLGSEHPDTLLTYLNLAHLYVGERKYEQAEHLLKQTLATSERVLGLRHLHVAQNLNLLARLYYEQGKYEQVESLWKRSLAILEKTLGPEHPATAERLNDLAELSFAQGNYQQARSLCQKAINICEKRLGLAHPDTIAYRKHLARIVSKMEDVDNKSKYTGLPSVETKELKNTYGRVLILDYDKNWRNQLEEILLTKGYYAKAVDTVAKALEELQNGIYHILILDIQMKENHTENEDGIVLLENFKSLGLNEATKVILLSAYGTKERILKVLQVYEVADILEKGAPKMDLVKTVQEVFATKVEINLALEIHWQQIRDAKQAVTNLEINGVMVKPDTEMQLQLATELEDLLRRLFHRAKSIIVQPLTHGYSDTGILRVEPCYTNGSGHDVIIKFGDYRKIDNEYYNFNEYVQPYLKGRNTTIINFRRTSHLGGIIISLPDTIIDRLVNFGDFYHRAEITRITTTLDQLFIYTCGEWYANRGRLQLLGLAASYIKTLELDLAQIEQIVSEQLTVVEVAQQLHFTRLRGKKLFTNPFPAIYGAPYSMRTYTCITHGDFNQRNLLVDSNDHVWMLDFQETGEGHILRDLARLDSVIRFQLLAAQEAKLSERLYIEEILSSINRFSELEQLSEKLKTENPALKKVFSVVIHLRTLARKLVAQIHDNDMREYYVALLFNALNTIKFPNLSPIQREHALLSASLIVDRLESSNQELVEQL